MPSYPKGLQVPIRSAWEDEQTGQTMKACLKGPKKHSYTDYSPTLPQVLQKGSWGHKVRTEANSSFSLIYYAGYKQNVTHKQENLSKHRAVCIKDHCHSVAFGWATTTYYFKGKINTGKFNTLKQIHCRVPFKDNLWYRHKTMILCLKV